jgi:hypothetical protein
MAHETNTAKRLKESELARKRAWKAENMRHKRPALATLGRDLMETELSNMEIAAEMLEYYFRERDEVLMEALDGDSDAAQEFRYAYSDLKDKMEKLHLELVQREVGEYFDDCAVGLIGNRYISKHYDVYGFDEAEEDYVKLTSFEAELACTESGKRLMRRPKAEMLAIIGQCLGIVIAFLDIRHRFDYLQAAFETAADKNKALEEMLKNIEEAYYGAAEVGFRWNSKETQHFERLTDALPDIAWIS